MSAIAPKPPSVTIIGGFLGAGKTTLLLEVLRRAGGLRIGVLVNDFGALNVDAELVSEVRDDVMRLENGCICCSMRGEMKTALFSMLEREHVDHVVVEASGIADPSAIATALRELEKLGLARLDGLLGLVDAEQFSARRVEHRALLDAQVRSADLLLLTKTDLVSPDVAQAVEAELDSIAPGVRVMHVVHGDAPLSALFGVERSGGELHEGWQLPPTRHDLVSVSFEEARPMRWLELAPLLMALPSEVYRVKGFMNLAERQGDRILLQVVGKRVYLRTLGPWVGEAKTSLVLLGKEIDPALLERFSRCA